MATSTATVTVTVTAVCQVAANDDAATLTAPGVAINDVRSNDDTCAPEANTLSASTPVPPELSFNTSTGQVDLLAGAAAGVYSFDYELATTNSSDVATVTITYQPPPPEECYPPVCGCTVPYCGGGGVG